MICIFIKLKSKDSNNITQICPPSSTTTINVFWTNICFYKTIHKWHLKSNSHFTTSIAYKLVDTFCKIWHAICLHELKESKLKGFFLCIFILRVQFYYECKGFFLESYSLAIVSSECGIYIDLLFSMIG